jgi:hypothetical protein
MLEEIVQKLTNWIVKKVKIEKLDSKPRSTSEREI